MTYEETHEIDTPENVQIVLLALHPFSQAIRRNKGSRVLAHSAIRAAFDGCPIHHCLAIVDYAISPHDFVDVNPETKES